jgi:hypothetical protein
MAGKGKAKKTRVQTGFKDETNVEILTGLKPEPVILLGKRLSAMGRRLLFQNQSKFKRICLGEVIGNCILAVSLY